ncbi:MAG: IS21 family transposase [Bacteroidales bacterium]|nr:IS21 family transposase [Bacteroidales bacterium]
MKDENTGNRVIVLHSMGWSIRRISREVGISRGRVRRWLVSNSVLRDTTPEHGIKQKKQRKSKLDPYKSYIGDLLERYSDITGQRVYEHLKEKEFDGGITIVRAYLKSIRQVGPKTPVRMVETDPGQRAAHDWSDYAILFTSNKPGEPTQVTFFSYILGYSRRQYISVVDDKKQPTLFRELIAAFIYLDGVPREIKSDNQKACVDRRELGQPVYNHKYLQFASHYRFQPQAITPGKPTENLKVERPFYYLERSFLNARRFRDMEDLKKQLQKWLNEVNDLRTHGTTKKRPIDLYIEEHPYLQPLPVNHYDTSHVTHLVVNQESCVQWKGYHYVVPQKYMFELCPVRITEEQLVVYSPDGEQLITHPLAQKDQKGRYVGAHQKRGKKPDLPISDVVSRLEGFAPEMSKYIEQVKRHKSHSWGYHLRRLLALKVNYRIDDIMVAVRRAQEYRVYEAGDIEGFLKNNSEPRYSVRLSFKPRNNSHNNEC